MIFASEFIIDMGSFFDFLYNFVQLYTVCCSSQNEFGTFFPSVILECLRRGFNSSISRFHLRNYLVLDLCLLGVFFKITDSVLFLR